MADREGQRKSKHEVTNCWSKLSPLSIGLIMVLLIAVPYLIGLIAIITYYKVSETYLEFYPGAELSHDVNPLQYFHMLTSTTGRYKSNKSTTIGKSTVTVTASTALHRRKREDTDTGAEEQPCAIQECEVEKDPTKCDKLKTTTALEKNGYYSTIKVGKENCIGINLNPWTVLVPEACITESISTVSAGAAELVDMSSHKVYKNTTYEMKYSNIEFKNTASLKHTLLLLQKHFPLTKSITHVKLEKPTDEDIVQIVSNKKPEDITPKEDATVVKDKLKEDANSKCFDFTETPSLDCTETSETVKEDYQLLEQNKPSYLIQLDKSGKAFLKGIEIAAFCKFDADGKRNGFFRCFKMDDSIFIDIVGKIKELNK